MNAQKKRSIYIDILPDSSAVYPLKCLSKEELTIVVPDLFLSVGDISDADDYNSRRADCHRMSLLGKFSDRQLNEPYVPDFYKKNNDQLLAATERKIRVWYSPKSSEDLCLLYYLCHKYFDKEIYVISVPDMGCRFPSREIEAFICGNADAEFDLNTKDISRIKHYLSFYDSLKPSELSFQKKSEYRNIWNKLVDSNSELRIVEDADKRINECQFNSFHEQLMNKMSSEPFNLFEFSSFYYSNQTGTCLTLKQIDFILKNMLDTGILKVVGTTIIHPGYAMETYLVIK